jgi:hypothetical protein
MYIIIMSTITEDYLDEDPVIQSQQWACLSIFTPNSIKDNDGNVIPQENKVRGVKIRGVFSTKAQAEKRCEEIRIFDKYHNVFIGEVGKWLPWDDDVSKAEEAVYAETKLNDMMKAYHESQIKGKEYAEERKIKAHLDAKKKKKENDKLIKEEKKKEELKSEKKINIELIEEETKLNSLTENLTKEQEELEKEKEIINIKENTINKIDDELLKAKEIYEQLMNKYNSENKN